MKKPARVVTLLCGPMFVLAVTASPAAAKPKYTFKKIAETGDTNNFGVPAINASGTVVHFRLPAGAAGYELVTSHGGAAKLITTIPGPLFSGAPRALVSINASGAVAFAAYPLAVGGVVPNPGIYVGSGGALTTILPAGSPYVGFGRQDDGSPNQIAINDAGTVAFMASKSADSTLWGEVYTGDGGALTLIAAEGGSPSINAAGVVAYQDVAHRLGSNGIQNSPGSIRLSDGTVIDQFEFDVHYVANATAINASGRVAFRASGVPITAGDPYGIFIGGGAGPKTTVAVNQPSFAFHAFGPYVAINAAGTVVFDVELASGAKVIVTGQDPVADKVVATGDTLFGSKIKIVTSVGPQAINDRGQIAFDCLLADGRYVLVVATPASAPPIYELTAGDVVDSAKAGKDSVAFKGTIPRIGASYDPRTSAGSVSFGDAANPVTVDVAAGDPGWKGKKGKWTWTSAKGVAPHVVLAIDAVKATFSVSVTKLTLASVLPVEFLATLSAGAASGTETVTFADGGKGRLRYRYTP